MSSGRLCIVIFHMRGHMKTNCFRTYCYMPGAQGKSSSQEPGGVSLPLYSSHTALFHNELIAQELHPSLGCSEFQVKKVWCEWKAKPLVPSAYSMGEDTECCMKRQQQERGSVFKARGVSHPGGSKRPTAKLLKTAKSRRDREQDAQCQLLASACAHTGNCTHMGAAHTCPPSCQDSIGTILLIGVSCGCLC